MLIVISSMWPKDWWSSHTTYIYDQLIVLRWCLLIYYRNWIICVYFFASKTFTIQCCLLVDFSHKRLFVEVQSLSFLGLISFIETDRPSLSIYQACFSWVDFGKNWCNSLDRHLSTHLANNSTAVSVEFLVLIGFCIATLFQTLLNWMLRKFQKILSISVSY